MEKTIEAIASAWCSTERRKLRGKRKRRGLHRILDQSNDHLALINYKFRTIERSKSIQPDSISESHAYYVRNGKRKCRNSWNLYRYIPLLNFPSEIQDPKQHKYWNKGWTEDRRRHRREYWMSVVGGERGEEIQHYSPFHGRAKGKVELRRDAGSKGRSEEGVRLVGQSVWVGIESRGGLCVVWLIDNLTY